MQLPVMAIADKKTGLFGNPFVTRHTSEAIREWAIVTKDQSNKYGKNPEDFDLYEIAMYDDETGKMEPLPKFNHLATGL